MRMLRIESDRDYFLVPIREIERVLPVSLQELSNREDRWPLKVGLEGFPREVQVVGNPSARSLPEIFRGSRLIVSQHSRAAFFCQLVLGIVDVSDVGARDVVFEGKVHQVLSLAGT